MAVTPSTAWEARTTGATGNGGGFDPSVASPGTDYSQQAGSQKTYTDLVIDATDNTKATSAGNPFQASDVGNVYNVTSGTGFTVQRAVLISVSASIGTFNNSLGTTSSSGGNATMGGALATLTGPALVAGNKVWVKATATYTIGGSQAIFTTAGTVGAYIVHEGYNATRGDDGVVTVQRTAGSTFSMLTGAGTFRVCRNFVLDGNSGTSITGFAPTGSNVLLERCKAVNCTSIGFQHNASRQILRNCWASGCSGTAGFNLTSGSSQAIGCVAEGNTCPGFIYNQASTLGSAFFIRCIAANNSGGSSQGFKINNTGAGVFIHCVAYNNGSDGILFDTSTVAGAADNATIFGCILESNAGYGINANALNLPVFNNDYNAFYGNGSGPRNNLPAGAHSITLTGSAFTNAAGGDFTLNNTAGAGAACRAAGFPGALQAGGTGYLDIGTLQHQDSGGGGASPIYAVFD